MSIKVDYCWRDERGRFAKLGTRVSGGGWVLRVPQARDARGRFVKVDVFGSIGLEQPRGEPVAPEWWLKRIALGAWRWIFPGSGK